MKYGFICIMLFVFDRAIAQGPVLKIEENGIYLSDSDFLSHHLKDGFPHQKGNKLNDNRKDYLIVKTKSVCDTFYFDRIWGFRKDGVDWRICSNEYYKVDFVNEKICIYDLPGTGQSEGIRTTHYFSRSASAAVYPISKRNLLHVYSDNPAFSEKMRHLAFTRSVFKWDKEHHNYAFVSWL